MSHEDSRVRFLVSHAFGKWIDRNLSKNHQRKTHCNFFKFTSYQCISIIHVIYLIIVTVYYNYSYNYNYILWLCKGLVKPVLQKIIFMQVICTREEVGYLKKKHENKNKTSKTKNYSQWLEQHCSRVCSFQKRCTEQTNRNFQPLEIGKYQIN